MRLKNKLAQGGKIGAQITYRLSPIIYGHGMNVKTVREEKTTRMKRYIRVQQIHEFHRQMRLIVKGPFKNDKWK